MGMLLRRHRKKIAPKQVDPKTKTEKTAKKK